MLTAGWPLRGGRGTKNYKNTKKIIRKKTQKKLINVWTSLKIASAEEGGVQVRSARARLTPAPTTCSSKQVSYMYCCPKAEIQAKLLKCYMSKVIICGCKNFLMAVEKVSTQKLFLKNKTKFN